MSIGIESEEKVARSDPTREYLQGGPRPSLIGGYGSIAGHSLRVTESAGPELADMMGTDEKIAGCERAIHDGILSQGSQITATIQIDPDDGPEDIGQAEIDLAFKVEDHCERCWRGLKQSRTELLRRMLHATRYRTMLAEVVRRIPDSGPDEGLYVLDRIAPKDPGTWAFVLDPYGNVRGIQGYALSPDAQVSESKIFPREKFLILAWLPRGSRPWGQGLLEPVYNSWNFKVQLYPKLWDYAQYFALPTVHATTPENAEARVPYDAEGQAMSERALPATVALHRELLLFIQQKSRLVTTPYGTLFDFKTPPGNGGVFQFIFDQLDRAIVYGMHNTTLTMGVQGKRANGTSDASGQDMLGLIVTYGKRLLQEMLYRDLWHPQVAYNFGPDVADRFTPDHTFGMTNPEDFSRNSNAITRMYAAGLIVPDERTDALRSLGLMFGRRRRKSDPSPRLSPEPQPGARAVNIRTREAA